MASWSAVTRLVQAGPEVTTAAERARVPIIDMGDFPAALGDIPGHWRTALATFPTLHKLLSLQGLLSLRGPLTAGPPGPLLYLDCDTYLFGDVATLAARYDGCDFRAREEPLSGRSHHGYDPSYLDEQALAAITAAEGLVPVPPYNTGVMLLSGQLASTLVTLLDEFVWYAWRLLTGMCLWRPDLLRDDGLADLVRDRATPGERALALAYPSSNAWIIEEIATWLTLGRVPGLTHGLLHQPDVVQSDEYLRWAEGKIVAHYFSTGQDRFFDFLRQGRAR